MAKIVYLPLDERPCNYSYPQQLAAMTTLDFIVPERSLLGNKKEPADIPAIQEWLKEVTIDADYLIASIDLLVYGGIVPSRLHQLSMEQCLARLHILAQIKQANPKLKIYAYNLIMRTPAYDSSDEEPDYYEYHGRQLYLYGWLTDKAARGELTAAEETQLVEVKANLPGEYLDDFMSRRYVNSAINSNSIDLVSQGVVERLIIPLDDNSAYGFTAQEQRQLVFKVAEMNLMDRVAIYPGADEIGCTLFARVFCETMRYTPEIFVRYSSTLAPFIIPKLEDRTLNESIKHQLTAAGAVMADHSRDAHAILMVHAPAVGEANVADGQPFAERHASYYSEVNIPEFVHAIENYLGKGKLVALADVATINGSDSTLMDILSKLGLLADIAAYAGWNTMGNTLGTVIAHTVIESYYHTANRSNGCSVDRVTVRSSTRSNDSDRLKQSRVFYYSRLVEDWGYQAVVRGDVCENDLPSLGVTVRDLSSRQNQIEKIVAGKLETFVHKKLQQGCRDTITLSDVHLPWRRMFEVGFTLELQKNDSHLADHYL
ncbi:DUF4127 family protein [Numidum massiliense]|uniref:DUF4127 family protein n=1 Tax=Numidum massiliense TaxID=1522315 RepID=UPI0006D582EC|nr:DUF4127 family protein [Numidum massiliense]